MESLVADSVVRGQLRKRFAGSRKAGMDVRLAKGKQANADVVQ